MKLIYETDILKTVFTSAESLYKSGCITKDRFQEYADGCLKNKIIIDDDYFINVIHENEELEQKKIDEWWGDGITLNFDEYKKSKTRKII